MRLFYCGARTSNAVEFVQGMEFQINGVNWKLFSSLCLSFSTGRKNPGEDKSHSRHRCAHWDNNLLLPNGLSHSCCLESWILLPHHMRGNLPGGELLSTYSRTLCSFSEGHDIWDKLFSDIDQRHPQLPGWCCGGVLGEYLSEN